MPIVDLSHRLTSGMPVYPGDPQVRIELALTVPNDGVAVHSLQLGSHSGTHLDAPAHSIVGGRTVEQLDLELLDGAALVLQVSVQPHAAISVASVLAQLPEIMPARVCVATGWDTHFHSPLAQSHPHLSVELAHELWARGARVLCVDTLSPDPTGPDITEMPIHDFWLGNDGIIVENLAHLRQLPVSCEVSLLPLALNGVDGSPIRAIARVPVLR